MLLVHPNHKVRIQSIFFFTLHHKMERYLHSGIFKEEICIHFLNACMKITHICFDELFEKCTDHTKIKDCLALVCAWPPHLFEKEISNIHKLIPNIEDMFKSTFIIFVKCYHQRPGCPTLQIRMSLPPVAKFLQNFILQLSTSDLIYSGLWRNTGYIIPHKDICMDICREIMYGFIDEYVIVQEMITEEKHLDDIQASDSASNIEAEHEVPVLGVLKNDTQPKYPNPTKKPKIHSTHQKNKKHTQQQTHKKNKKTK